MTMTTQSAVPQQLLLTPHCCHTLVCFHPMRTKTIMKAAAAAMMLPWIARAKNQKTMMVKKFWMKGKTAYCRQVLACRWVQACFPNAGQSLLFSSWLNNHSPKSGASLVKIQLKNFTANELDRHSSKRFSRFIIDPDSHNHWPCSYPFMARRPAFQMWNFTRYKLYTYSIFWTHGHEVTKELPVTHFSGTNFTNVVTYRILHFLVELGSIIVGISVELQAQ